MQSTSPAATRAGMVLMVGLTTLSVSVQAQMTGAADTARQHALARLQPGTEIRVSENNRVFQGTLRRLTPNQVILAEEGTKHSLMLRSFDTLWVARRATGKGALAGALVGLGIGALVGAGAAPGGSDTPPGAYAAIYGGIGLLGGALLGVVAGSSRQWERKYPTTGE
jgi:hypothetical protein